MLEKKTINKFGEHYLLGIGRDNKHYYLEAPSWDCNWYWGFGYIHSFTNDRQPTRSADIDLHTHFDSLFLSGDGSAYDKIDEFFKEIVIDKDDLYKLVDYMMSYYTLKETAALMKHGCSWQTERARIDCIVNKDIENKINKEMLPALFEKIKDLLTK